jgi:hypothetical protein
MFNLQIRRRDAYPLKGDALKRMLRLGDQVARLVLKLVSKGLNEHEKMETELVLVQCGLSWETLGLYLLGQKLVDGLPLVVLLKKYRRVRILERFYNFLIGVLLILGVAVLLYKLHFRHL